MSAALCVKAYSFRTAAFVVNFALTTTGKEVTWTQNACKIGAEKINFINCWNAASS